ncbi:MAG: response regulator transcription factor [Parvularculaceae bacterium]
MFRRLAIYGVCLALGAFALEWIEYQYLTRVFTSEIYVVLIAGAFLALGVWVGARLTRPRVAPDGARNEAAIRELGITAREYAVLEHLAAGKSNKEIARSLSVSPNTVKSHLARLFAKLEVRRRTEAIARARQLNLIV